MAKLNSILLIDDDNINNFIVINKLNSLNLVEQIVSVDNGEQAIAYIKECIDSKDKALPELILLDINMPVMDGWDFLEEFTHFKTEEQDQMHIYMVSSSVYNEDIEKSKQYPSVKMFISKPLHKDKMKEIILSRMKNS